MIMKKLLRIFPLMLLAFIGSAGFTACSDDDDHQIVAEDQLPTTAKTFIEQYYPSVAVVSVHKDKSEYEVVFSDGTRIDFDHSGNWQDVDAPAGKAVPSGFYPAAIDSYVATNYPADGINEISKDKGNYEVDLISGIDLEFSSDGSFIRVD